MIIFGTWQALRTRCVFSSIGAHADVPTDAEPMARMNNPESQSQVGGTFDEEL
jgi:hypothetical protein